MKRYSYIVAEYSRSMKFKGFKFALDKTIYKFFISSQVEELVDLFS